MIWNVRFCKYTTFPCNFCFFCFYIYINLNLSIWKYLSFIRTRIARILFAAERSLGAWTRISLSISKTFNFGFNISSDILTKYFLSTNRTIRCFYTFCRIYSIRNFHQQVCITDWTRNMQYIITSNNSDFLFSKFFNSLFFFHEQTRSWPCLSATI